MRKQVEIDLKSRFGNYNEKNKCFLEKIDKENFYDDDLYGPAPDATHYCLKVEKLEYLAKNEKKNKSNGRYEFIVYILVSGPAVNKEMEILEPFSPSKNTQSHMYYLLVARASGEEKNGFRPNLIYYKELSYSDIGENNTGIICINSSKNRIGFTAAQTVFLGRGLNGYEFSTTINIVELSSGFLTTFNSYAVKNSNYPVFENGFCRNRR